MTLEKYFQPFRENIIGKDKLFETPFGEKKIVYADWIASGRMYKPIEDKLRNSVFPFVANTHTQTSTTGATMSLALNEAMEIIKNHVGATKDDVLIGIALKLSKDKGLFLSEIVLKYIITRVERSYSSINKLINKLDEIALEKKKKITVPFVKEIIDAENLK